MHQLIGLRCQSLPAMHERKTNGLRVEPRAVHLAVQPRR